MAYVGVKFISKKQAEDLLTKGFCRCRIGRKQRQGLHPEIGDTVSMLLDDNSRTSRRIIAIFVKDEEVSDGGCISVYKRDSDIITPKIDPEEEKHWE